MFNHRKEQRQHHKNDNKTAAYQQKLDKQFATAESIKPIDSMLFWVFLLSKKNLTKADMMMLALLGSACFVPSIKAEASEYSANNKNEAGASNTTNSLLDKHNSTTPVAPATPAYSPGATAYGNNLNNLASHAPQIPEEKSNQASRYATSRHENSNLLETRPKDSFAVFSTFIENVDSTKAFFKDQLAIKVKTLIEKFIYEKINVQLTINYQQDTMVYVIGSQIKSEMLQEVSIVIPEIILLVLEYVEENSKPMQILKDNYSKAYEDTWIFYNKESLFSMEQYLKDKSEIQISDLQQEYMDKLEIRLAKVHTEYQRTEEIYLQSEETLNKIKIIIAKHLKKTALLREFAKPILNFDEMLKTRPFIEQQQWKKAIEQCEAETQAIKSLNENALIAFLKTQNMQEGYFSNYSLFPEEVINEFKESMQEKFQLKFLQEVGQLDHNFKETIQQEILEGTFNKDKLKIHLLASISQFQLLCEKNLENIQAPYREKFLAKLENEKFFYQVFSTSLAAISVGGGIFAFITYLQAKVAQGMAGINAEKTKQAEQFEAAMQALIPTFKGPISEEEYTQSIKKFNELEQKFKSFIKKLAPKNNKKNDKNIFLSDNLCVAIGDAPQYTAIVNGLLKKVAQSNKNIQNLQKKKRQEEDNKEQMKVVNEQQAKSLCEQISIKVSALKILKDSINNVGHTDNQRLQNAIMQIKSQYLNEDFMLLAELHNDFSNMDSTAEKYEKLLTVKITTKTETIEGSKAVEYLLNKYQLPAIERCQARFAEIQRKFEVATHKNEEVKKKRNQQHYQESKPSQVGSSTSIVKKTSPQAGSSSGKTLPTQKPLTEKKDEPAALELQNDSAMPRPIQLAGSSSHVISFNRGEGSSSALQNTAHSITAQRLTTGKGKEKLRPEDDEAIPTVSQQNNSGVSTIGIFGLAEATIQQRENTIDPSKQITALKQTLKNWPIPEANADYFEQHVGILNLNLYFLRLCNAFEKQNITIINDFRNLLCHHSDKFVDIRLLRDMAQALILNINAHEISGKEFSIKDELIKIIADEKFPIERMSREAFVKAPTTHTLGDHINNHLPPAVLIKYLNSLIYFYHTYVYPSERSNKTKQSNKILSKKLEKLRDLPRNHVYVAFEMAIISLHQSLLDWPAFNKVEEDFRRLKSLRDKLSHRDEEKVLLKDMIRFFQEILPLLKGYVEIPEVLSKENTGMSKKM